MDKFHYIIPSFSIRNPGIVGGITMIRKDRTSSPRVREKYSAVCSPTILDRA